MNLKKILSVLLIGAGLAACSDRDDSSPVPATNEADTYVNLSVTLPGGKATRALPEDYNPDGIYEGLDGIETLDVYMLSADGTVEAKRFTGTDISSTGTSVSPSQPFRTTSGYKTIYIVLNNPGALGVTITTEDDLIGTEGLARLKTINGVEYDIITMTGKAGNVYIAPDVPMQDVVATGANKIPVDVTRVASRVIVTTTASADLIDADSGQKIGSVSNVTYSVAQGTNKIYWIGQADFTTWGSEYVTELGNYEAEAPTYYDYADLSTPSAIPAKPAGTEYKAMKGKFLFENTHKEGNRETTEYRKGNTAYVLVRAIFTPDAAVIADGGALTNGTFYVGQTDGKIYSSKQAAQDAVQNQKVATYVGGKMLNYAWLNPDDVVAPLNSPVLRNNIYHVNITGFKRLGFNWNPLFPENPDTENPENPDPKPGPEEPEIPIDPVDPLTPEQTYMSVEVTVQDWTVHSYDIEF